MSLQINNSEDITLLRVAATFDISGVTPIIELENLSTGPDLASCTWWFTVYSPTNTPIHEGSEGDPDITGNWSDFSITDNWPRPFNQIEFSGAPYKFQAFVKDGNGNIYYTPVQQAVICRPNGNTKDSKNTYGVGSVTIQTKCDQARIFFQDTTNTSYKGLEGVVGSSVLRVNFPMDNTGVVPDPFQINYFSTAMVPITFSGKGYQFLYTSIYEYDLGDDVYVRIKYLKNDTFGVWCNIDLMPLVCEFEKLSNSLANGTCVDVQDAQNKMNLITPKFFELLIGVAQPLTGVDVPVLIEEIKKIGGFDCDCCTAATGIVPTGSSAFDGYTFSIVSEGGDIGGSVVPNGYNIQFLLHDVKYIVKICDGSPSETTAFEFIPSVSGDGYTKTYCLSVDVTQFGFDLGNAIASNASLLNFWQALLADTSGNFTLIVDGDCIFSSSATCDYDLTLSNIPINTTFALLTGIKIGSTNHPITFSFNLTNLPALQTYLNTLGFGTFTVTNPSGQTVLIETNTNGNDIQQLTYKISVTNFIADLSKTCTGFVPVSANEVVQNIINYICNITDAQIVTSADYQICYIDPSTRLKTISTVAGGEALTTFITELLARGCDTIDYVVSLSSVDCAAILAKFPTSINVMQANDLILGTKAGACARMTPNEFFLYLLTYGQYNADVLAAFCNMIALCAGGSPCAPYNVFQVEVDAGSPSSEIELIVTFDHPAAVSHTIRYARIDNTVSPVYITIPGVLPGESPYTIDASPALENGQYRIGITPVYADGRTCPELFFETPACTGITSFSAEYDGTNIVATYTADPGLDSVRFNLFYPNGGSFSQIYTNGDPISVTPPPGVYGTFNATLQAVCEPDTDFMGAATAPAVFVINPSSNSSIENLTASTTFNVEVLADSTTVLATSTLSPASTISFYLADGTYTAMQVRGVADGFIVRLVTGTGTYYGVSNGLGKYDFSNVPILNGAVISILDDGSPVTYSFSVDNSAASTMTDISPVFYLIENGELPLTTGNSLNGTHGAFTGVLSITNSVGDAKAELYINTVFTECLTMAAGGAYGFTSRTYNTGDAISIIITNGSCS